MAIKVPVPPPSPRGKLPRRGGPHAVGDETGGTLAPIIRADFKSKAREGLPHAEGRLLPGNFEGELKEGKLTTGKFGKDAERAAEAAAKKATSDAASGELLAANVEKAEGQTTSANIEGGLSKAITPLTLGGFVLPVVSSGASKAAGWVGDKANSSWLKKLSDWLAKPAKFISETTFGDVSKAAGGKGTFSFMEPFFNVISTPVDWLAKVTGISKRQQINSYGRVEIESRKVQELAHEITKELHTLPDGIQGAAQKVTNLAKVEAKHFNIQEFNAANEALTHAAKGVKLEGTAASVLGKTTKLAKSAEEMAYHSGKAKAYANVAESVKGAPAAIAKGKIFEESVHYGFIGLSLASMFKDFGKFRQDLGSLKQMYADATGQDVNKVSTVTALFGDAPPAVVAARRNMLPNLGIKQGLDFLNIILNVKSRRMGMMASVAGFMGVDALSKATDKLMSVATLSYYNEFSKLYQSGKTIDASAYAKFLAIASPELAARGERDNFTQALAEKYAEEKVAPAELMKRIGDGGVMADLHHFMDEAKQTKHAVPPTHVAAGPSKSFVNSVVNGHAAQPREVHGKHTNQLVQAAAQNGIEDAAPARS